MLLFQNWYFWFYAFIASLAILSDKLRVSSASKVLFTGFLFITLYAASATRDGVGSDWDAYRLEFESWSETSPSHFEMGFAWLMGVIKASGGTFEHFVAIASLPLLLVPLLIPLFRTNESLFATLFFFATTYVVFLGGMRQALASVLVLVIVHRWLMGKQNMALAGGLAITGGLFHRSAIAFSIFGLRPLPIVVLLVAAALSLYLQPELIWRFGELVPSAVTSMIDEEISTERRDWFILTERAIFAGMAYLRSRQLPQSTFFRRLFVLELGIFVSFFLLADLNRALIGRTMLYLRFFDYFCFGFVSAHAAKALLILYCAVKIFFTYYTVPYYL